MNIHFFNKNHVYFVWPNISLHWINRCYHAPLACIDALSFKLTVYSHVKRFNTLWCYYRRWTDRHILRRTNCIPQAINIQIENIVHLWTHNLESFIEKVPAFLYYTTMMCRSPRKRCLNYAQLTLTVESGAQTTPPLPDTQTHTDGKSHDLTHQPNTPSANLFPKPAPNHFTLWTLPGNASSTLFSEDIRFFAQHGHGV